LSRASAAGRTAACLGAYDDFMAEPFRRFREAERMRLAEVLAELSVAMP
jgi:hypothetical protein